MLDVPAWEIGSYGRHLQSLFERVGRVRDCWADAWESSLVIGVAREVAIDSVLSPTT